MQQKTPLKRKMMNSKTLICLILMAALAVFLPSALRAQDKAKTATIYEVTEKGDLSRLKNLLSANTNLINAHRERDGATPLHLAVLNGHLEVARYLINMGADVNAKTAKDKTPLHLAASKTGPQFPGKQLAEALIAAGAKIDLPSNDGSTALHYAAQNNAVDVADLLIQKGADVNAAAKYGIRPLHNASLGLNQAAGDQWVGDLLIANKADVNATAYTNHVTALWMASGTEDQNYKIVEKLLKAGADPKIKVDGLTPLQYARASGNTSIVAVFEKNGVKE
jgi:ankyrin repeat protein